MKLPPPRRRTFLTITVAVSLWDLLPTLAPTTGFAAETAPAAVAPNALGASQVAITIEGEHRVIRANGLPNHAAGHFPNRNNPNRIAPQTCMSSACR